MVEEVPAELHFSGPVREFLRVFPIIRAAVAPVERTEVAAAVSV